MQTESLSCPFPELLRRSSVPLHELVNSHPKASLKYLVSSVQEVGGNSFSLTSGTTAVSIIYHKKMDLTTSCTELLAGFYFVGSSAEYLHGLEITCDNTICPVAVKTTNFKYELTCQRFCVFCFFSC